MKKTIEINDCLPDHVESAVDDIKTELENYLKENEPTTCPDWGDLDYRGSLHEIIDGAVPIYTRDIEAAWFLYGSEIEQAYEDSGIGDNPREHDGTTAIYCYIESKAREWWSENAEPIFEAWQEAHNSAEFFKTLEARLGGAPHANSGPRGRGT